MAEPLDRRIRLSAAMTLTQFENGYWYATELKRFAKALAIPSATKLRKDELERAIETFLRSGAIRQPTMRDLSAPKVRDVDRGLRLGLRVVGYGNNTETKRFLEQEMEKLVPGVKRRSGARYRLNRWREAQLLKGIKLTYRDLVNEYARLNQSTRRFARVPHGRYINFMSDFLAGQPGATRAQAIEAWAVLKTLAVPKTYRNWVKSRPLKSR